MNKKHQLMIASVVATATLVFGAALPAFAIALGASVGLSASAAASGTVGVSAGAQLKATLITRAQDRADQEITRRLNALNSLSARVNEMQKLSTDEKSGLSATIQSQIGDMNTLEAQIATDASANSTSSLKADIQAITKSYRIFMLVIPQGAISAASDRVMTIVGMMTTLSGNLQTRITAAQTAGSNMSVSVSALADLNAKIADANTQAQAAVTETAGLQPDNGVQAVMQSNTAALKDARSKIQTAQQDLTAARKDAGTIVKVLIALKDSASAGSTTTVSASTSAQ